MSYSIRQPQKGYPDYRPSLIHGIDSIPKHWETRRLKNFYREADERSRTGSEELMTVSYLTGVTPRKGETAMPLAESTEGYKVCRSGDIVINTMVAFKGALGVAPQTGLVSPSYGVYRPVGQRRVNSDYMSALLRTDNYKTLYSTLSTGIIESRFRLYADSFLGIHVPVPPLDEQAAIVRYLDDADQRIRKYVSAKERLIVLLEEERQAVIYQAVTRGLDPNVRLKPSGVVWLGEVPEHWDVAAVYHKYSQSLGKMLDTKRVVGNHLVPYLRNIDVQWDRISIEDLPSMDIPPNEYERYTVKPGDLLVCEGGEVGRSAIWSGELAICGFQKALHRLRPLRGDAPRFLYYVLRAAVNLDVFDDGHVSTIPHLTGDKLRVHRFPFPPIPEQNMIVDYLDEVTNERDHVISRARRQIELMEEYRTRLIADVVTGKVCVTGSVPATGDTPSLCESSTQRV